MNNVLRNIIQIAENERITVTKLEQAIGASKGVLSRAIGKNSDIQLKWVLKIVEIYPQYSCEWLIKGEGSMIKNTIDENFQLPLSEDNDELSYKKLAEARKETIESLQKVIFHLEKEINANEKRQDSTNYTK